MQSRSRKQLEDAIERNNLSGKGDEFFNKLKSSGYEPLPDPTRFRISKILKPLIVIGIIGGLIYLGYNFLTSENKKEGTTNNKTNQEENIDSKDDQGNIKSNTLSINIKDNISIGDNVEISYSLPNSFSGEDIDSKNLEIHLLKEDNSYAGYIGNAEFNKQQFIWNPKKLYESNENDVVKAPAEGNYKLVIALRDESDTTKPLADIENKNIGTLFSIDYDRLSISGDKSFAECYDIADYKPIGWYTAFKNAIDKREISENSIQFICYSAKASLVVFASSKEFTKGYPTIMRFLTETESLSEAVYTASLNDPIESSLISVGKRKDSILPILINRVHTLNYDFLNNTISPA